jgi:hypothetical protein
MSQRLHKGGNNGKKKRKKKKKVENYLLNSRGEIFLLAGLPKAEASFRPQAQTPGIPHIRSCHLTPICQIKRHGEGQGKVYYAACAHCGKR